MYVVKLRGYQSSMSDIVGYIDYENEGWIAAVISPYGGFDRERHANLIAALDAIISVYDQYFGLDDQIKIEDEVGHIYALFSEIRAAEVSPTGQGMIMLYGSGEEAEADSEDGAIVRI